MTKYRIHYSTPISSLVAVNVTAPSATAAVTELKKFEIPTRVIKVFRQDESGKWITVISTPKTTTKKESK